MFENLKKLCSGWSSCVSMWGVLGAVLLKFTSIAAITTILLTGATGLSTIKPAQAGEPIYYFDWNWNRFVDLRETPTDKYPQWLDNKSNIQDKNDVYDAISWEIYKGDPQLAKDKLTVKYKDYFNKDYKYIGGRLRLTDKITRAEFAAALARTLGINVKNGNPWYIEYVKELNKLGIIPSISGNWSDTSYITREEMGQWIGRAAKKYNIKIQNENIYFTDTNDENIILAAKTGIIKGSGNNEFKPNDNAQRVEAALMLIRMVKNMEFNTSKPTDEQIKTFIVNYEKALNSKQTMQWGNKQDAEIGYESRFINIYNDSLIKPFMTDLGCESIKMTFGTHRFIGDATIAKMNNSNIRTILNNGKFIKVGYVVFGDYENEKNIPLADGIMYITNEGGKMKISSDVWDVPDYILNQDNSSIMK